MSKKSKLRAAKSRAGVPAAGEAVAGAKTGTPAETVTDAEVATVPEAGIEPHDAEATHPASSTHAAPCPLHSPMRQTSVAADKPSLPSLEQKALRSLEAALAAIRELSTARLEAKLSVSRLAGVGRELRELLKVMSVYGC